MRDPDELCALMRVTVAPALVSAVDADDAHLVEQLLTGLDRQRLYALALVLAASHPDITPRPRAQSRAAARLEDYAWCRWHGSTVEEAAVRVGITVHNARSHYEPAIRETTRTEGTAA